MWKHDTEDRFRKKCFGLKKMDYKWPLHPITLFGEKGKEIKTIELN